MTLFGYRALTTTLLAGATMGVAMAGQPGLRLLPTNGASTGDVMAANISTAQNLSFRGAGLEEISVPNLGVGYRTTLTGQGAFVQSSFQGNVDGSAYDGMYVQIANTGTTTATFAMEVWSELRPNWPGKLGSVLVVQPGETLRAIIYQDRNDPGKQMKVMPPLFDLPAQIMWGGDNGYVKSRVNGWMLWNMGDTATLELKDLRLIKKRPSLAGIIDPYGQNADLDGDWKVRSDGDLVQRGIKEADDLARTSDAALAAGNAPLGTGTATGRWRFERATNGNWFPVDPNGKRTWILGANNVYMDGQMILDGKEDMYSSLPPREGPFGQFYKTAPYFATGQWLRNYDMYRANLYKKFGQDYETKWRDRMSMRMRKWGLNAVAGSIDRGITSSGVPYMPHVFLTAYPNKLVVPNPFWSHPNDPYAADFGTWCTQLFKGAYGPEISSPRNLIGLTVGNEETWGFLGNDKSKYQIPIAALNAAPTQPCKQPLIDVLKKKYVTISALNASWGRSFSSWDALKPQGALGDPTINAGLLADLKLMLTVYAEKNYSTIRASLLKAGYKGLFLGSRVALQQTPDEVLVAENKYVDAHTINNYEMDADSWARIARLSKPVIISEFSYSATDRGHYGDNKNWEVSTQAERAAKVRAYLDRAARTKNVVGAFFFGYAEEPFTGRWSDDERMNVGLIDMTDTPYKEVTSEFRAFGNNLSNVRKPR